MKAKNKIVCLAMAATMAVGGFAPVQAVADEGSGYEALYYFSDYAGSLAYRNGVIASAAAEYQLATSDIHYYDYSNNADNFWGYVNIDLSSVPDNAFVIFERRTEENIDMNSDQGRNFFEMLEELFSSIKTQGCKIMLIYGTNEAKFNPESMPDTYNKFLEYIDIHINLDIFYNYMDSVFTYLEEENGEMADVTFILNENFVPSISDEEEMSGVMGKYILPYFAWCWEEELPTLNISDVDFIDWLAHERNIHFLCEEGSKYYELRDTTSLDYLEYETFSELINKETVVSLGAAYTAADSSSITSWIDGIQNALFDIKNVKPIFVYNLGNCDLEGYLSDGNEYASDGVMTMGGNSAWFDFKPSGVCEGVEEMPPIPVLSQIMKDFILGYPLDIYANCEGRCEITYMPVLSGNGWVKMNSVGRDCWAYSFL